MNLFIKIYKSILSHYRKEFIECLTHNSNNSHIKSITVFTDEIDHNIKNIPKVKVIFKKKINSNVDLYRVSKPNFSKMNIISEPFVKFNDLAAINQEELDEFIIKNKDYIIFSKESKTDPKSNDLIFTKKEKYKILDTVSLYLKPKDVEVLSKSSTNIIIKKSKANPTIKPIRRGKKLDVIIVSVNYNDYLVVTLEENVKNFNNITVVTSPNDIICQEICKKFGVNCVITEVMYEDGATFNKGKAINEGIRSIKNPDIILLLDADIIVENPICLDNLSDETLYTSERIILPNYQSYINYKNNKLRNKKIDSDKGYGFFQLFCIDNKSINKECPFPETSNDAAWSDICFRDKFEVRENLGCVLHLGESFMNWKGRVTNKFLSDEDLNKKINSDKNILKISLRSESIKPKLAVITTFFNPNNYINIKYNYSRFSKKIKEKCDLFTIELSFDGNFYLEGDNILKIKGNKSNILWQKERLLNILLEKISEEYTNIAWVDCDILFENENWITECNEKLQKYKVVQLYEFANRLNQNDEIELRSKGIVKRISEINQIDINLSLGIPGFSWAIRREVLDEIKFLDTQIIGGADSLMFYSFFGQKKGFVSNQMNTEWYNHFENWSDKAYKLVNNSVGFVSGEIIHLYHGKMSNRKYNDRYKILAEHNFNPSIHLKKDEYGLWSLKDTKITNKLKKYFENREEDDNIIEINAYFDKVFVLNLDRKPERFKIIKNKLNKLDIKFDRFSAIDGSNLEFDNSKFKPGMGMIENEFALGCLLSHLEIIKEAKRKNYKRILIFEDDVLISDDIKVMIQHIRKLKTWKLLYFGSSQYNWDIEMYSDSFYLSKKSLGTFAYAVDSSIYDDIIDVLSKREKSVDNLLSEIQEKYYGKCFTFYPNICKADVSESEIRENRNNIEHSKKMKWDLIKYV